MQRDREKKTYSVFEIIVINWCLRLSSHDNPKISNQRRIQNALSELSALLENVEWNFFTLLVYKIITATYTSQCVTCWERESSWTEDGEILIYIFYRDRSLRIRVLFSIWKFLRPDLPLFFISFSLNLLSLGQEGIANLVSIITRNNLLNRGKIIYFLAETF